MRTRCCLRSPQGITSAKCQDPAYCDKRTAKGEAYVDSLCSSSVVKIGTTKGVKEFMDKVCKVACKTCLRDSGKEPADRPIGCVLDADNNPVLYPRDPDANSVFWDGSPFTPICKSKPCGATRGYLNDEVYAKSREEVSTCKTSLALQKALQEEEGEQ